jgi:beta-glucanase (GH16 family)
MILDMLKAIVFSAASLCTVGVLAAQAPQPGPIAAPGAAAQTPTTAPARTAAPTITTRPAQNGALLVSLASATPHAKIFYTEDGAAPTPASQPYLAPFLVAASLTVKAIAVAEAGAASTVTSRSFALNVPSGTLVWSDEFNSAPDAKPARPDPSLWTYDTGGNGFGNHELEHYCAWGSNAAPCSTADPNAYVGNDGSLHIVARQPQPGVYTSARLKSEGLFSVQYGRIEFRAKVPEAQGLWPAAWLLGNNIATVDWPACGEIDVLERVDAALSPDWNEGSVHGTGFTGDVGLGTRYYFPAGQSAAGWHTYGVILSPNRAAFYVDDPDKPYVTYTNPASLKALAGSAWPFDAGQSNFLLLNMAVGGDWPKSPDATTKFPAEMLIDYVRVYTN